MTDQVSENESLPFSLESQSVPDLEVGFGLELEGSASGPGPDFELRACLALVWGSPGNTEVLRQAVARCVRAGVDPNEYTSAFRGATYLTLPSPAFNQAVADGQELAREQPGTGQTTALELNTEPALPERSSLSQSSDSCPQRGAEGQHRRHGGGRGKVSLAELADRLLATARQRPTLNSPTALVNRTTGTTAQLHQAVLSLLANGRITFAPTGVEVT